MEALRPVQEHLWVTQVPSTNGAHEEIHICEALIGIVQPFLNGSLKQGPVQEGQIEVDITEVELDVCFGKFCFREDELRAGC
jgi:hypothetical protein